MVLSLILLLDAPVSSDQAAADRIQSSPQIQLYECPGHCPPFPQQDPALLKVNQAFVVEFLLAETPVGESYLIVQQVDTDGTIIKTLYENTRFPARAGLNKVFAGEISNMKGFVLAALEFPSGERYSFFSPLTKMSSLGGDTEPRALSSPLQSTTGGEGSGCALQTRSPSAIHTAGTSAGPADDSSRFPWWAVFLWGGFFAVGFLMKRRRLS